ncbi:MAG: HEAT repeat domain-containing protein [Acidobacteria bacterium]|nr:HEAT repeat domain-containing protein [Acidobacteriota bacterium]MBI3656933.1 HEAT repeat domain-containing protein [Acidobacteriota bacterium]
MTTKPDPSGKGGAAAAGAKTHHEPVSLGKAIGADPFTRSGAGVGGRRFKRGPWLISALLLFLLVILWLPKWMETFTEWQERRALRGVLAKVKSTDGVTRAIAACDLRNYKGRPATAALLSLLQDSEWAVRYEAILSLGYFPKTEEAPAEVIGFLNDSNPNLQDAAATTLGLLAAPLAVEPLVEAYLHNQRLRPKAKLALEMLNEPHVPAYLVKGLSDPDADARAAAARVLGAWGDDGAIETLIHSLQDSEPEVRLAVVDALGEWAAINGLDPDRQTALAGALTDTDSGVRRAGALAVAKLPEKDRLSWLLTVLQDGDPTVRAAAIQGLRTVKSTPVIDHFVEALRDDDAAVRVAALVGLAAHKASPTLSAVVPLLADEVAAVRSEAIRTLGALGAPGTLAVLRAALKEQRAPAFEVAAAMGELRDPNALPWLLELARTDDHRLRLSALSAITQLDCPSLDKELQRAYDAETRAHVKSDIVMAVQRLRSRKAKDK